VLGYLGSIAGLALASLWAVGFSVSAFLLIAIVSALLVPMMIRAQRGELDLFEPIVAANVALGVMFVGRPLADLFTGQFDHLGYDIRPTFDETLAIALLGILCLQAGYFSPLGAVVARRIPGSPRYMGADWWSRAAWVLVGLGALLFWMFLRQEGGIELLLLMLGGRRAEDNELYLQSTGYFYQGPLLWAVSALLFFAVGIVSRKRRYYFYALVVSVAFFILYGTHGTRSHLLIPSLALPVFWFLRKNRRPQLRTVLVAVVLGLALLGWLREIRTAGEYVDVAATLAKAVTSPVAEAVEIVVGADAEMFDALANELLVVPEKLPFQHGATAVDVLVRAVPRPLWPEKPLEANDAVVNALWPEHYSMSRASSAFSIVGPFYADSGVSTVMIGMFILGIGLASMWQWFRRYAEFFFAQLLYSASLPLVAVLMRGTIPDTLARALFVVGPLLLVAAIVRSRIIASSRALCRQ
jgi:hypothetical protein